MMRSNVPRTRMSAPASSDYARFGQNPVRRTGCRARQGDSPAARQAHPCAEPARKAADHRRDGSRLCAAVCELIIRPTKRSAACPLFRRCSSPSSTTAAASARATLRARVSIRDGTFQVRSHESVIRGSEKRSPKCPDSRIHPRCRRPDRQFPLSGLQKQEKYVLQGQALH